MPLSAMSLSFQSFRHGCVAAAAYPCHFSLTVPLNTVCTPCAVRTRKKPRSSSPSVVPSMSDPFSSTRTSLPSTQEECSEKRRKIERRASACPRSWPWRRSSPSKRPTAGKSGSGVHPVPPGRAPGRQRQHRQMAWVAAANPVEPIASPFRAHFVRAMVHVHEYPDGQLAIFHGPHRLAEYGPDGSPRDDAKLAA